MDEDLTNLNPNAPIYDQLMSCMEQNLKMESGILNDKEENEILKSLQGIGSPDPKSQAAIDEMPQEKCKRYNDATMKEFEGMKAKYVIAL